MKKNLFLATIAVGIGTLITPYYASAAEEDSVVYSLENDTSMNRVLQNEEGELYTIEVEKVPEFSLMSSSIIIKSKGSYKITKSLPKQWNITYYISINSNYNISNANQLSINILKGTLKNSSLTFNKHSAVASIERKIGLISNTSSVTATISDKKLVIK